MLCYMNTNVRSYVFRYFNFETMTCIMQVDPTLFELIIH